MDRVAEAYLGRVQVATVDVSDAVGRQLGERYGAGSREMAFVYFDGAGRVVQREQSITEADARKVLDGLLADN